MISASGWDGCRRSHVSIGAPGTDCQPSRRRRLIHTVRDGQSLVLSTYAGSGGLSASQRGSWPWSGGSAPKPCHTDRRSGKKPPVWHVPPTNQSASAVNQGGRLMATQVSCGYAFAEVPPPDLRAKYTNSEPSDDTSLRRS